MKQKRIRVRPISDEEGEEEKEDGDRRNSLRKSKKIKYIDDYDDEEEAEEEGEDEDQEGLPITCGDKKGFLDVEKLSRGEQCILSNGSWLSPPDFEEFGGKGSSKKWKASIFHEDKPLQDLFDKGILTTKGFKRRRSDTSKPKKILSSDESESRSEASEIQSAEETEEDDVKDDDWHPGSEELALEREEGEEERVGAENGGEVVDSGDDKSKEEEDKMEKGEMEDEDVPAVTDNDNDNSDFEDRGTNLIISASVINTLKTVKIVIPRLQEAKTDRRSSCSEHPKEGL
ncbi:midasin-like isoform X1 [Lates japonicus]